MGELGEITSMAAVLIGIKRVCDGSSEPCESAVREEPRPPARSEEGMWGACGNAPLRALSAVRASRVTSQQGLRMAPQSGGHVLISSALLKKAAVGSSLAAVRFDASHTHPDIAVTI